jgi:nitroreductase
MEFSQLIHQRYSVRAYQSTPVENEKLQKVLDAARLAPTAANRQPFQLVVVHTKGREAEFRRMYHREWLIQAPIIIFAVGLTTQGWVRGTDGKNYTEVDVSIAFDHLILEAANQGLGTCWIAAFNPDAVRQALNLPEEVDPIALTPLGYPADQPPSKKVRKSLSELVRYERW